MRLSCPVLALLMLCPTYARAETLTAPALIERAFQCSDTFALRYALSTTETAAAIIEAVNTKCTEEWSRAILAETYEVAAKSGVDQKNGLALAQTRMTMTDALQRQYRVHALGLIFDARATAAGR